MENAAIGLFNSREALFCDKSLDPVIPRMETMSPGTGSLTLPVYRGEFWTARQRQALSLHEISYRACFKAQLPRYFINRLSRPGDPVYDPFSGRGTTALEAALLDRIPVANDLNPLSETLCRPRLFLPDTAQLQTRLAEIARRGRVARDLDLSMFYHPDTEKELLHLRRYLQGRRLSGQEDHLDRWIRMVATNRLTGHSPGFFSVYTLPPNQAVSRERQEDINRKRGQAPEYRDTHTLILRKTRQLLRGVTPEIRQSLKDAGARARFLTGSAQQTPQIQDDSIQLTVTSPPFLNVVQYANDNWLRCWFNHLDPREIAGRLTVTGSLPQWREEMRLVFGELFRITRPGGWVAFEVGEVHKKSLHLDREVIPLGLERGFTCRALLINQQQFTKTANIWGISNNSRGTNSNRIVLFQKSA
ncbi:MAG TPA: DNA methyltransferase [Calditrichia bacterium]|nr:DNA methyltransferase [Calditrichia bacterium]